MKRVNYFLAGMALMFAVSCVAPEEWGDQYANIVPGPVTNVEVVNVNGGAIISYVLPSRIERKDMLGAKVVYSLTPGGELMERWASAEANSIEIEGFGDTNPRTVTIYAVHNNGNVSEGVERTVKPEIPLIAIMRESLKTANTFGGVQVTWDNPMGKDVGIALYVEDPVTREMVGFDNYYSASENGRTVFRPLDPKEQKVRVEMFDRWQNYAQPLDTTLTPYEEIEILPVDGSGRIYWTAFDPGTAPGGGAISAKYAFRCDLEVRSWNNSFTWDKNSTAQCATSSTSLGDYIPGETTMPLPWPRYVTFNMGRKAAYSRFGILAYRRSPDYSGNMPVEFDVWGTNNAKLVQEVECPYGMFPTGSREANQAYWSSWPIVNGTDAWKNDWVKLATVRYYLTDGGNEYYDGIVLSAEDKELVDNGYEFEFNLGVTEAYQYLRWEIFKYNSHAAGTNSIYFSAIKYWGSYAD